MGAGAGRVPPMKSAGISGISGCAAASIAAPASQALRASASSAAPRGAASATQCAAPISSRAPNTAAALPAKLIGDIKNKRVADLCAAPGGKTMQLAAAGANLTAVEISKQRITRLRPSDGIADGALSR